MKWEDKTSVKKGNLGEKIIDEYIAKNSCFVPYHPVFDGSHPFDRLCATKDKKEMFIAEIKTKPARLYYPDTGIDYKHYKEYKFIEQKYNLRIFLFFVDEVKSEIYGNYLDVLDKDCKVNYKGKEISYPKTEWNKRDSCKMIYFPLINTKFISNLKKQDSVELKSLNKSSYGY